MAQNIWDEEDWDQTTKHIHLERESWTTSQILNELLTLPAMPDEDDPLWNYSKTWYNAEIYLALSNLAEKHHLETAIPIFFQKASYGDPGEILRGVFKNGIFKMASGEKVLQYAIESSKSSRLGTRYKVLQYAIESSKSSRLGTRYWAIFTLSFFNTLPHIVNVLEEALNDSENRIQVLARTSLT